MKTIKRRVLCCLAGLLLVPCVLAAEPVTPMSLPRPEFQTSAWAKEEVDKAYDLGLFHESAFLDMDLTGPITRSEFRNMAMAFLSAQEQLDNLGQLAVYYLADKDEDGRMKLVFHDQSGYGEYVDRDINYQSSIAYYLGLVEGRGDGTFDPDGLITRDEAAVMLTRAYQVLDQDGLRQTSSTECYRDHDAISSWAIDSANALNDWKVMIGTEPDIFSPKGNYTREQCIATFLRLYENCPVSRKNGNVPAMFTYDQILACVDAYETGITPEVDQSIRFRQNDRWEGPTATAIDQSMWGVMLGSQRLFFVYRDGRLREFDIGLYNIYDNLLTDSVQVTDGAFSEDGGLFTCTAVVRHDFGDQHKAGLYHITVDVENLEVTQTWEPLPEGMFDQ